MNFNDLLGGVGKDFMSAAGDALVGAAKEYLGNAIQEIFVKKEADTRRQLANIQHMKVVSCPAVLRALLVQRILFNVWRLFGDMGKQRLAANNSNCNSGGRRDVGPMYSHSGGGNNFYHTSVVSHRTQTTKLMAPGDTSQRCGRHTW